MRIEHAGYFKEVIDCAREHGAASVSIQSYWIFCNFDDVESAEAFLRAANYAGWEDCFGRVNTERPFIPAEVAIRSRPK